jgi:hypothetical protein
MTHHTDLTGQRFERLSVVEYAGFDKHRRALWKCLCDCGKESIVVGANLRCGYTKSCGCLFSEMNTGITREVGKSSRLYKIWAGMKQRCSNSKNKNYDRYGGRGITVCPEWMEYKPFQEWALSHGYATGLTIERVENNKGYGPENCEWKTRQDQAINRDFHPSLSGERGVSWHKHLCKWYARVIYKRKVVYSEYFDEFDEAVKAVKIQRSIIFK